MPIKLLERDQKLGANQPDHCLIPAFASGVIEGKNGAVRIRRHDPIKPTKGWRTAWRKLTEEAGLKGLQGHDLRYNWITSHAEIGPPVCAGSASGASVETDVGPLQAHQREGSPEGFRRTGTSEGKANSGSSREVAEEGRWHHRASVVFGEAGEQVLSALVQ
jgi:hypothetical protein